MTILSRRGALRGAFHSALAAFVIPMSAYADELADGRFKQEVIALLKRAHPELRIVPSSDPEIVVAGTGQIFLGNLYREVRDAPKERRDAAILAFIKDTLGAEKAGQPTKDESFSAAQSRLRPQIVPDVYPRDNPDLLWRPFLGGVSIAYVLDYGSKYQLLRQERLQAWKMEQAQLEIQAINNLEAESARLPLDPTPSAAQGAFMIIDTMDGYDAARLLLPRLMARLRAALKAPRVFVGIPNRDFLIAWTPDFTGRKPLAARLAEDVDKRPHPLTSALFVSSDDGVSLATDAELRDHGR